MRNRIFTQENIQLIKEALGRDEIPPYILRDLVEAEKEFIKSPASEIIGMLDVVNILLSKNPLAIKIHLLNLEKETMKSVANAYTSLTEANKVIGEGLKNSPKFIQNI
jgi:hypothetical protein